MSVFTNLYHLVCNFLYLKAKVEQLTAELQVYNDLKRRVEESAFKKNLQRNIQVVRKTIVVNNVQPFEVFCTSVLSKCLILLFRNMEAQGHSGSLSRSLYCLLLRWRLSVCRSKAGSCSRWMNWLVQCKSLIYCNSLSLGRSHWRWFLALLCSGGEESVSGGPDRPYHAAERGPEGSDWQLPGSHSVSGFIVPPAGQISPCLN